MKVTKQYLKKLIMEELTKEMSAPVSTEEKSGQIPSQEVPLSEKSCLRAAGVINKILKYHAPTVEKHFGRDTVDALKKAAAYLPEIWPAI
jgi:hypothetical protein